ncbi:MAG TPA: hypothetical protein VK139_00885 [Microbacteriaceae bacterium]|nr:hypothetical protein [Microbacteriaceae bacterium]
MFHAIARIELDRIALDRARHHLEEAIAAIPRISDEVWSGMARDRCVSQIQVLQRGIEEILHDAWAVLGE